MILMDTNHVSLLKYSDNSRGQHLASRLRAATGEVVGVTVITVEEQMRGWMAAIAKERQPRRQVTAYCELAALFAFFSRYHVALFDDRAAERFEQLKSQFPRTGGMDLKIAAVALVNDALLLTANRGDFEPIPGLRCENWLN